MPAFSLLFGVFLLAQAFVAVVATRQARTFGARYPRVVGVAVFVLGVAVVFALGGVLEPLLVEAILLLAVSVLQREKPQRSAA